ncbi:MAG TPA: class I SAM-dependent methyltransferase [Pyrinomonadaceae bacterium]|jgi:SAM-dependent methyltransferase
MDKRNELNQVTFYYSNNIDYYDYLYHDHLAASESLLNNLLVKLEGIDIRSVLDACCGSGHDVCFFLKNGFSVDASDLSYEMVAHTKAKAEKFDTANSIFFQSDVLELSSKVQRMYDLVIFRGNTLGHLSASDQLKAVNQLYDRTKPGKFLLFDFRDGNIYYQERKPIELRGYGIDKTKHLLFFSFYSLRHPQNISDAYHIYSSVFFFNYFNFRFKKESLEIEGNYVNTEAIVNLLSNLNCTFEFLDSYSGGLPYLKTVLVRKGI